MSLKDKHLYEPHERDPAWLKHGKKLCKEMMYKQPEVTVRKLSAEEQELLKKGWEKVKAEGNECWKTGDVDGAIAKWKGAQFILEYHTDFFRKPKDLNLPKIADNRKHRSKLLSNLAAAYLKQEAYSKCVRTCEDAFGLDSSNEKAAYRRAKGLEGLKKWRDAMKAYMKVSKKFPKNKSALQDAHRMKKEIEKVRETAKMKFEQGLIDSRTRSKEEGIDEMFNKALKAEEKQDWDSAKALMLHCFRRCGPKGIQDLKGEQSVVWHLAFLDGKLRNQRDALKWWERLLALSEKLNDESAIRQAHENIGKLMKDSLGMHKECIPHWEWSHEHALMRGEFVYASNSLQHIFECFKTLHRYAEAITVAERAIKVNEDAMESVEKPGDMFPVPETHPDRKGATEFEKKRYNASVSKEMYWDCFHQVIEFRCNIAECIQLQGRRLELSKEILEKCCADTKEVIQKRGKYGRHGHPARGPYRAAEVAWRNLANFHSRKEEWVEAAAAMEEMCLNRKRDLLYRTQGKDLDHAVQNTDAGYKTLAELYKTMIGTPEAMVKAEKALSRLSTAALPVVDKRAGVTAKSLLKADAKEKAKKAHTSRSQSKSNSAGAAIPKMKWSQTKRNVKISFYDLVDAQEESVSLLVDAKRRLFKFKVMHGLTGEREFAKILSLGGAVVGIDIKGNQDDDEEAGGKSKAESKQKAKAKSMKKASQKGEAENTEKASKPAPEDTDESVWEGLPPEKPPSKIGFTHAVEKEEDAKPKPRVMATDGGRRLRHRSLLSADDEKEKGQSDAQAETSLPTGVDEFDDFSDALEEDGDEEPEVVEREKKEGDDMSANAREGAEKEEEKGDGKSNQPIIEDEGDEEDAESSAEVTFRVLEKGSRIEIIIPKAAGEKKMWHDLEGGKGKGRQGANPYSSKRNDEDWAHLIEDELKLQKDEAKAMRMMAEWINDMGRNGTTVKFA